MLGQLNETLTFDSMAAFDQLRPSIVLPRVIPLLTGAGPPNLDGNDDSTMFGSFAGMFDEDGGDGWGLGGEVLLQACRCVHLCLDARPAAATAALSRCNGVRALVGLLGAPPSSGEEEFAGSAAPLGAGPGSEAACMALTCLVVVAALKPRALGPARHASDNSLAALFHGLDFYPLDTQRLALSTVAHFCRRAPPNAWPLLLNAAPHLTALATAELPCGVHVLASLGACGHALTSFLRVQPLLPPLTAAATNRLSERQRSATPSSSSGGSDSIAQGAVAALAFASHGLFEVAAAWLHLSATPNTSAGPTVPPSVLRAAVDVLTLLVRCRSNDAGGSTCSVSASQHLALWDDVAALLSAAAASQSNTTNNVAAVAVAIGVADTCDRLLALAIELCPQPPRPLLQPQSLPNTSSTSSSASVETVATCAAAASTPKKRRKVQRWVRVVCPQGVTLHGIHELACSDASSSAPAATSRRWKGRAAGVAPWSDQALMAHLRDQELSQPPLQQASAESPQGRVVAEYGAVLPLLSTATDARTGLHRHVLGQPQYTVPWPLPMEKGIRRSGDKNDTITQSGSSASGGGGGGGRQDGHASIIAAAGVALEGGSIGMVWCNADGGPVSHAIDLPQSSSEDGSNSSMSTTAEAEGRVVVAACELALREPLESAKLALAITLAHRVLHRRQLRENIFLERPPEPSAIEAVGGVGEAGDLVASAAQGAGGDERSSSPWGRYCLPLDGNRGLSALVGAALRHGAPTTRTHGLGIAAAVLSGSSGQDLVNSSNDGANSTETLWWPRARSIEELQRWGVFAFAIDVVAKHWSVSEHEMAPSGVQRNSTKLYELPLVKLASHVLKVAGKNEALNADSGEVKSMKEDTASTEEESLLEASRRLTRAAAVEVALSVAGESLSMHRVYLDSLSLRSSSSDSGSDSDSNNITGSSEAHAASVAVSNEIADALEALLKAATSSRGVTAHQWVASPAAQTLAAYLTADPSLCPNELPIDTSRVSAPVDEESTPADGNTAARFNGDNDEISHGALVEPGSPQGVQLRGARDLARQRRRERQHRARALAQLRRRRVGVFLDAACCAHNGSSTTTQMAAQNDTTRSREYRVEASPSSTSRFDVLLQLVLASISLRVGPADQQQHVHRDLKGIRSKPLPLVLSEPCGGAPATSQRRQVNRVRSSSTPHRQVTPPPQSSSLKATAASPAPSPTAAAQATSSSSLAATAPTNQTRTNEGSRGASASTSLVTSFAPAAAAAKVAVRLRSRIAKRLAELGAGSRSSRSSSKSTDSSSSSSSSERGVAKNGVSEQTGEVISGNGSSSRSQRELRGTETAEGTGAEDNQEEFVDEDEDDEENEGEEESYGDDDDDDDDYDDGGNEEEEGSAGSMSSNDAGDEIGPERAMRWLCKTLQVLLRVRLVVTPPPAPPRNVPTPSSATTTAIASSASHSATPREKTSSPRAAALNPIQRLLGSGEHRYCVQPIATSAAVGSAAATSRLVEEIPLEVEPLALLSTLIEHALGTTLPRLRALQTLRERKIAALQQRQGARLRQSAQASSAAAETNTAAAARSSNTQGNGNNKLRLTLRCSGKVILSEDCDLNAQPLLSPGTSSAQLCLLPALHALTTAAATAASAAAGGRAEPSVSGGGGGRQISGSNSGQAGDPTSVPSAPSLKLWFQPHVLDLDVQFLQDNGNSHFTANAEGAASKTDATAETPEGVPIPSSGHEHYATSNLPITVAKSPSPLSWWLEPATLADWSSAWPEDELLVPTLGELNDPRLDAAIATPGENVPPQSVDFTVVAAASRQRALEANVIGDEDLLHQLLLLKLMRAIASASPLARLPEPVNNTSKSTAPSTVASDAVNDTTPSRHEALVVASAAAGALSDPRAQWLPTSKHAWHSHALAAKLSAQLDDPLVVVCATARESSSRSSSGSLRNCGAFPAWASLIVECVPFALPLDLRLKWLHATAFGPAHAARATHAAITAKRAAAAATGEGSEHGSSGDGGHRGSVGAAAGSNGESASVPPAAPRQLVAVDRTDVIGALRAAALPALGTSCLPVSLSVSNDAPGVDENSPPKMLGAVMEEEEEEVAKQATSASVVKAAGSILVSNMDEPSSRLALELPLLPRRQGPLGGMKLEASFKGEPGSGLGPTKEFLALLSDQLACATAMTTRTRPANKMANCSSNTVISCRMPLWRGQDVTYSDESPPLDSYFFAPLSLRASFSEANTAAAVAGASIVGWACMQAIQDDLLLDLPLAPPLLALLAQGSSGGGGRTAQFPLLGSRSAALRALATIDNAMAKQLVGLLELAANHNAAVLANKQSRDDVQLPADSTGGNGPGVDGICSGGGSGSNSAGDGSECRNSSKNSDNGDSSEIADPVAALELDWTLPGYPEVSLLPFISDSNVLPDVTSATVELWVACALFAVLLGLVGTSEDTHSNDNNYERQQTNPLVAALRFGAGRVAHPACLAPFSGNELAMLLTGDCNDDDDPVDGTNNASSRKSFPLGSNSDAILASLECAHGYDHSSASVQYLARALATWSAADQKQFVRFATGSPKLPRGGLSGLRPRLTVVKASGASWHHLPSAATCTHYLKLPNYPSEAVLEERLRTAVQEGQGAFYLS